MTAAAEPGTPLHPGVLERLGALLAVTPRAPSEYSVANLWLYRHRHDYRLVEDDCPAVHGRTYDGERHAMPLGALDARMAARLLDRADCIYPLEAGEAEMLAAEGCFTADDRPADADYLYDAASLAVLDGAKRKRAQAASFDRTGPRMTAFEPDAARAVLRCWLDQAGRGPDHADAHECAEAIDRHAALSLSGATVRIDEVAVGFVLAGPGAGGQRIVHFAKGRRDLPGLYPWMFARFAADRAAGAALLNFEQDLGNAGLAQAKQALAPTARIRKFRLRKTP